MYETREIHLTENPRIKVMVNIVNNLQLQNSKILDFGCLDGTFLSKLKNGTNEFYGLDASEYAVKQSTEKGIIMAQFFYDDVAPLPYEDNTFDLVILGEVIEHIYDTDYLLQELHRILKPTGKLLVSTPNLASLARRIALLLGINPIIELSPNEVDSAGHIRYFTFSTLHQLLKKNGFEPEFACSDVINFDSKGRFRTFMLPKLLPTFGASIINLSKNNK